MENLPFKGARVISLPAPAAPAASGTPHRAAAAAETPAPAASEDAVAAIRPLADDMVLVRDERGAEGFWRFHDALFEDQQSLERSDLEAVAERQGLDMERFNAALDDHTHAGAIDRDVELAERLSQRLGEADAAQARASLPDRVVLDVWVKR